MKFDFHVQEDHNIVNDYLVAMKRILIDILIQWQPTVSNFFVKFVSILEYIDSFTNQMSAHKDNGHARNFQLPVCTTSIKW